MLENARIRRDFAEAGLDEVDRDRGIGRREGSSHSGATDSRKEKAQFDY